MKRGYESRASFTVEAALLMTVILPVLIAIWLAGAYLHDRGYLQGTAIELAAMGSNLQLYSDRDARIEKVKGQRVKHALLWTRGAAARAESGEGSAAGETSGTFHVPGLAAALLGKDELEAGGSWRRKIYRPANLIWKVRAVRILADDVFS